MTYFSIVHAAIAFLVIFIIDKIINKRGTNTEAPAKIAQAPASPEAVLIAARLGISSSLPRLVVTLVAENVLLNRKSSGEWDVDANVVAAVRALGQVADLHLLTRIGVTPEPGVNGLEVSSTRQEEQIKEQRAVESTLRDAGVIFDSLGSEGTRDGPVSSTTVRHRPSSIPAHKVLFFTTEVGKVAIVRQLRPRLHLDTSEVTLRALSPHIKNQTRILFDSDENRSSFVNADDGGPWREVSISELISSVKK